MSSIPIPPAIQALLESGLPQRRTWEQTKDALRRILREIQPEAERSLFRFRYVDRSRRAPAGFTVLPAGPLDPLSTFRECLEPRCRAESAEHIARTVGVYADTVVLMDTFTDQIATCEDWTDLRLMYLTGDLIALMAVRPLLEAGVIRFASPVLPFCSNGRVEFENALILATDNVFAAIAPAIRVKHGRSGTWIEAPEVDPSEYVHIMAHKLSRTKRVTKRKAIEVYRARVADEVRQVVFATRHADALHGVFLSAARLHALALATLDGGQVTYSTFPEWEAVNSVSLPWFGSLSVYEVLELRAKAPTSLKQLRHFLRQRVAEGETSAGWNSQELIAELRGMAAELEGELQTFSKTREAPFNLGYGALGIVVSLYSLAAKGISYDTAITSLLALLGVIHQSTAAERRETEKLKAKPAYALLKAAEIHSHSPAG